MAETRALLRLTGITKLFPGCIANDKVDLQVGEGEIHGLIGENGAGKSTLVKIIYGVLQADAGNISWQGKNLQIPSPAVARTLGIGMVFQHFSLFEALTVVENIALGLNREEGRDQRQLSKRITDVAQRYGLPIDPSRTIHDLSVGERQRVEIIRCLLQKPRLLIMDEPTSVLTLQETEQLFITLRRLADENCSILYISHKLQEITALCHSATILRQGRTITRIIPSQESVESMARTMIGEELTQIRKPASHASPGQCQLLLQAFDLPSTAGTGVSLHAINLAVCSGEIIGIAGLAGNGQDELLAAISGEKQLQVAEDITLLQQAVGNQPPDARRRLGLCVVPEQRLGHATVPIMSLTENTVLSGYQRFDLLHHWLIDYPRAAKITDTICQRFDVRCRGNSTQASSLSGGNLQKFIVGREVSQHPQVLVVAQPTWGVDTGAQAIIHQALLDLAASGVAVLIISQDLEEIMTLCDKVAVMAEGWLSELHTVDTISAEQLGLLMSGHADATRTAAHA